MDFDFLLLVKESVNVNFFDDLVSRVSFQANEKGAFFEITLRGAETK